MFQHESTHFDVVKANWRSFFPSKTGHSASLGILLTLQLALFWQDQEFSCLDESAQCWLLLQADKLIIFNNYIYTGGVGMTNSLGWRCWSSCCWSYIVRRWCQKLRTVTVIKIIITQVPSPSSAAPWLSDSGKLWTFMASSHLWHKKIGPPSPAIYNIHQYTIYSSPR